MAASGTSSGGSSTYTLNRAPPAAPSLVDRATGLLWSAVDVLTLFARSLLDPGVKSLHDAGRTDTGVRRVATVHAQAVRGSANPAGAGGGGAASRSSGNSGSSSSSSSSSGGAPPAPKRKIAGMGSVASCSTGG